MKWLKKRKILYILSLMRLKLFYRKSGHIYDIIIFFVTLISV